MAEQANRVTLWVDGQQHEGWSTAAVALNLDHIAGDFSLTLTEEYLAGGQLRRQPVKAGQACRLAVDGAVVLTGWVDRCDHGYTATTHQVQISGRDKTGDLVDCSAEVKEYLNQKLEVIAADMCTPFGIGVTVLTNTGEVFKRVAVNTGDTVQACIERMCRQRGVLLGGEVAMYDDQGQKVHLTRDGVVVETPLNVTIKAGQNRRGLATATHPICPGASPGPRKRAESRTGAPGGRDQDSGVTQGGQCPRESRYLGVYRRVAGGRAGSPRTGLPGTPCRDCSRHRRQALRGRENVVRRSDHTEGSPRIPRRHAPRF
jgi:hypothetical protein